MIYINSKAYYRGTKPKEEPIYIFKNGAIFTIVNTVNEAEEVTGVAKNAIARYARKEQEVKGFIFSYSAELQNKIETF